MDSIHKLQPHRTMHLQGFDAYGEAAALWGASDAGFHLSGVFRDQAGFKRLNRVLDEKSFDDFVEALCEPFYAETMGRPGLAPGIYYHGAARRRLRDPDLAAAPESVHREHRARRQDRAALQSVSSER